MPHEVSREFPYPRAKVYEAVSSAVPTIKGTKVKWADPGSGTIEASTRITMMSWGENVTIQVSESGPERSTVTVIVRLKAQFFGWGRQQRIIDNLFDTIASALAGAPAV